MTYQTATAWGLDSAVDPREWVTLAACRGADPAMFDVVGRGLTAENRTALKLCADCPVRTRCRDDYVNHPRVPLGLVAGGWWWDHSGKAHPHRGDVPGATARAGHQRPRERRINEHVLGARKAITAARAKLINPDLTYKDAAARYGSNFRAVCDGVFIGRYAPELLHAVWNGRRTLASAFAEATQRRAEVEGVAS